MTEDNDPKPPSKRKHRQLARMVDIHTNPPTVRDLAFMAREFILCTLPHRDPGDVLSWSRTNGDFTLAIKTGINEKTGKAFGIPYGIIPRLILVWIVTEIIRTKSRRLELGQRLSDFLLKLGLDPSRGGKCSDAYRTREQLEKLLNATISFSVSLKSKDFIGHARENIQIAHKMVLWWSSKDPEQNALWGSYIEISEEFYKAIVAAPHPLDIRVLRHIKDSSLGIDLYGILNREAFRAMKEDRPRFLAWEWLHEQTGNEYAAIDNFRRDAIKQVKALLAVHPGLIIRQQRPCPGKKSGLWISNLSTPSIPPEAPRARLPADPNRPPPELALVPAPPPEPPPPERHLKTTTIERFRALYPRLDPYACKADFDFWLAGLPPEKQPRSYDAAFTGFARKWIVGKVVVSNP